MGEIIRGTMPVEKSMRICPLQLVSVKIYQIEQQLPSNALWEIISRRIYDVFRLNHMMCLD